MKKLQKLNKELANLDKEMKKVTKDKKDNVVFISHESIGYLMQFKQEGVQNMNAEDPSQKN